MKLKLIYTGNPLETKVCNAETGEVVDGIVSAHIDLDYGGAEIVLVMANEIEIEMDNLEVQGENTGELHGGGGCCNNTADCGKACKQV